LKYCITNKAKEQITVAIEVLWVITHIVLIGVVIILMVFVLAETIKGVIVLPTVLYVVGVGLWCIHIVIWLLLSFRWIKNSIQECD